MQHFARRSRGVTITHLTLPEKNNHCLDSTVANVSLDEVLLALSVSARNTANGPKPLTFSLADLKHTIGRGLHRAPNSLKAHP